MEKIKLSRWIKAWVHKKRGIQNLATLKRGYPYEIDWLRQQKMLGHMKK